MDLEKLSDWQKKYIELRSQIDKTYTETGLAREVGVSRQAIYEFKQKHPDLDAVILKNIQRKYGLLAQESIKALYRGILRENPNPKLVSLALEMLGVYIPTQITKFDDPDKAKEKIRDVLNNILDKASKIPKIVD